MTNKKNVIPVFDAHQDISDMMLYIAGTDFLERNKLKEGYNKYNININNQSDYYRSKEAGLRLIFAVSCVVGFDDNGHVAPHPDFLNELFRHINLYHDLEGRSEGRIKIVKEKKDLTNWENDSIIRFILAIESIDCIDEDLVILDTLYNLGVRSMSLTYNDKNNLGGGCATNSGLTELGKRTIKRMNELGMILDLAHISDKGLEDALEINNGPVVMSHTGFRKIYNDPRNSTDEQIKKLVEKGGLVGIYGSSRFCGEGEMDVNIVADHFMHAVNLVGVDNVIVGSDFNGMLGRTLIKDFAEVSDVPKLFDKLRERGLSEDKIKKIAYKNLEKFLLKNLK